MESQAGLEMFENLDGSSLRQIRDAAKSSGRSLWLRSFYEEEDSCELMRICRDIARLNSLVIAINDALGEEC